MREWYHSPMRRSQNKLRARGTRLSRSMICLPLFLALSSSVNAQTETPQHLSDSAREFAQEFYSWYVPIALNESDVNASDFALMKRGSAFSPELLQALREDSAARAKSREIVGLDFDPFLASQDPDDRYEVGKVTVKGESYWIEVYGVRAGKRRERPAVLAELVREDGHLIFVNFHYPDPNGNDLLSILKRLRGDRQRFAR